MAHSLSPRAQADIDEIAYYISAEGGSLETAHRFLESIYRRFLLLGQLVSVAQNVCFAT